MLGFAPIGSGPIASNNTQTVTPPSGDTTRPVMVGSILPVDVTASSFTIGWQAATDDVAIGEYRVSVNGAAAVSNGLARTFQRSSLPPFTTFACTVTAYDTSGNAVLVPLTYNITTLAAPASPGVLATTVTFSVVDAITGAAVSGLTGLDYAFFDQARIKDAVAPVKKGSTLSISSGSATIDITGVTSLAPGQTGRVVWGTADGTKAGGGQVVVS